MDKIIEKYYISIGSVLVNYCIGTNGVDCWFDVRTPYVDGIRYVVTQHRCLSFEDFNLIKPNVSIIKSMEDVYKHALNLL